MCKNEKCWNRKKQKCVSSEGQRVYKTRSNLTLRDPPAGIASLVEFGQLFKWELGIYWGYVGDGVRTK